MNDHQLIELIKSADPLATDDAASVEVVHRIRLDDILAEPRSRPALRQRRRKTALLIALLASAFVVPTAIAFHSRIVELFSGSTVPSQLTGSYTVTLGGLRPSSQDGRWTLTFTPLSQYGGVHGTYTRAHNGVVVATGGFSLSDNANGATLLLRDLSGPNACPDNNPIGSAYSIHIATSTITTKPSYDTCANRRSILLNRTFTRS
jgi:hypothetical protein